MKRLVELTILKIFGLTILSVSSAHASTVARDWNEENLAAIRAAFPDPPVHARNLFHLSAAMYDAWAAYDPVAVGYAHNEVAVAS